MKVPESLRRSTALKSLRSGPHIIVVLGFRNTLNGSLISSTSLRCELAFQIACQDPDALVLPTGTFGVGFNESQVAHGNLIANYLVSMGINEDRVLPTTYSTRTFEDAVSVRVAAVDLNASLITIVTSEFHIERVKFLFGRVLIDFPVNFAASDDGRNAEDINNISNDIKNEKGKIETEAREWINFPLYGQNPNGTEFPLHIYNNASEEQRGYDRVSYLIISAMFIVFWLPYTIIDKISIIPKIAIICGSATFILCFYGLYLRVAGWATQARNLMYRIESQWNMPGFSYAFNHHRGDRKPLPYLWRWVQNWGFFKTLSIITVGLMLFQLLYAGALLTFLEKSKGIEFLTIGNILN